MDIRQSFKKDFKIPIPVLESPYFEHALKVYDREADWDAYSKWYPRLKQFKRHLQDVVHALQTTPAYQQLEKDDLAKYRAPPERAHKYPRNGLYSPEHDRHYFVSIDLVTAHFQALYCYDPELTFKCKTYREWIDFNLKELATQQEDTQIVDLLVRLKYFREALFGMKTTAGKIKQLEEYITGRILTELLQEGLVTSAQMISVSPDEIIFRYQEGQDEKLKSFAKDHPIRLRVEIYELTHAHPIHPYYLKFHLNRGNEDPIEIKFVKESHHLQVFKHTHCRPIEDMDLYFALEGDIAKYVHRLYQQDTPHITATHITATP